MTAVICGMTGTAAPGRGGGRPERTDALTLGRGLVFRVFNE